MKNAPLSVETRQALTRLAVDVVLLLAGSFGSTYVMMRVNAGVQSAQYHDLRQSVRNLQATQQQEFMYLDMRVNDENQINDPPSN